MTEFNCDGSSKTTSTHGFPSIVHVEAQNLKVNKNGERKYEGTTTKQKKERE